MRVIVVKLIMGCFRSGRAAVAAVVPRCSPIWAQVSSLVSGVADGLGQQLLGLGDEAGQGVQPDGGVAQPVGGAQAGELVDRVVEGLQAVVAGGRGGQLAGGGPGAGAGGS